MSRNVPDVSTSVIVAGLDHVEDDLDGGALGRWGGWAVP